MSDFDYRNLYFSDDGGDLGTPDDLSEEDPDLEGGPETDDGDDEGPEEEGKE